MTNTALVTGYSSVSEKPLRSSLHAMEGTSSRRLIRQRVRLHLKPCLTFASRNDVQDLLV